jgi:hypothetical protein
MDSLGPYRLNTVVQGDCLAVLPALPGGCADLVLTDPDWSQLATFPWAEFFAECFRISRCAVVTFWSAKPEHLQALFGVPCGNGYFLKDLGVWYKPNGGGASWDGVNRKWEAIAWFQKAKAPRRAEWRRHDDVWVCNRVQRNHRADVGHPRQKPEGLIEELLRFFTVVGAVVVDPFAGSNTVGLVAERTGRRWLAIEIDPEWVGRGTRRVEAWRGQAGQLPPAAGTGGRG